MNAANLQNSRFLLARWAWRWVWRLFNLARQIQSLIKAVTQFRRRHPDCSPSDHQEIRNQLRTFKPLSGRSESGYPDQNTCYTQTAAPRTKQRSQQSIITL